MLPSLVGAGLLPDSEMHRYHCGCPSCEFDSEWVLRAQTDSSCNGEVISRPFQRIDDALEVFAQLQEAAVEADAVPGYNAGWHVHVSPQQRTNYRNRVDFFWQWLRWEPVMSFIAAGCFGEMRDFNPTCRSRLYYAMTSTTWLVDSPLFDRYGDYSYDPTRFEGAISWAVENLSEERLRELQDYLYNQMTNQDRHSALSLETRFGTTEFRLWNSTRSAWRMEMYCRLSHDWMTRSFVNRLAEVEVTGEVVHDTRLFIDTLSGADRDRSAELVDRQFTYGVMRQGQPDIVLTTA